MLLLLIGLGLIQRVFISELLVRPDVLLQIVHLVLNDLYLFVLILWVYQVEVFFFLMFLQLVVLQWLQSRLDKFQLPLMLFILLGWQQILNKLRHVGLYCQLIHFPIPQQRIIEPINQHDNVMILMLKGNWQCRKNILILLK